MEESQPSDGEDSENGFQDSLFRQARARLSPFTESAVAEIATSRTASAVKANRPGVGEPGVNGAQQSRAARS